MQITTTIVTTSMVLKIEKAGRRLALYNLFALWLLAISIALAGFATSAYAGNRFMSNYPCSDSVKTCVSSGIRIIDGFEVYKECWEWSYKKTCNYPSKDDCKNYNHCYLVADKECLLKDSLGNCANLQREFSCKSWQPVTIDKEMVRTSLVEKEGKERLICKGIPCIDGNCFDQSYDTNNEMMDSISKLYAISQMKDAKDLNFSLFAGFSQSCSKKATSYTNCCSSSLEFWGKYLGAGCTKDEVDLIEKRQKNLCEYACKENKQTMGITTVVKHHYCCFGNLFNKVIQVEGRKQLFPSRARGQLFNNNGKPDCRGLTLAEIMRLDFNKMDFSEFYAEIIKRMKLPNVRDVQARVNSAVPNVKKYDGNPSNKDNNKSGWSDKIKDYSWEAEEEERLTAKLGLEKQQLAKEQLAREELAKEQEAKDKRKLLKEEELVKAKENYQQAYKKYCEAIQHYNNAWFRRLFVDNIKELPEYREYEKAKHLEKQASEEVKKIESELKSGNY